MTTRAYRLTTTSHSASKGAMQEAVVITAKDDAEAVELARAYVEVVVAEVLLSAILADATGTIVWWQGSQGRGDGKPGGSPRSGLGMSAPLPAYTVEQLAPGSYDVLLDGALVAALVHGIDGHDDGWQVDLLNEKPFSDRPPPFTAQSHTFRSLPAALNWLGIHERGIADAQAG